MTFPRSGPVQVQDSYAGNVFLLSEYHWYPLDLMGDRKQARVKVGRRVPFPVERHERGERGLYNSYSSDEDSDNGAAESKPDDDERDKKQHDAKGTHSDDTQECKAAPTQGDDGMVMCAQDGGGTATPIFYTPKEASEEAALQARRVVKETISFMLTAEMSFIMAHSDAISRRQTLRIRGANDLNGNVIVQSQFTNNFARDRTADRYVRDFFLPDGNDIDIPSLQLPLFNIGGGIRNARQLFETQALMMRQQYHFYQDLTCRIVIARCTAKWMLKGHDYHQAFSIAEEQALKVHYRIQDFSYYENRYPAHRDLSSGSPAQEVTHLPSLENSCGKDWCTCGRCMQSCPHCDNHWA